MARRCQRSIVLVDQAFTSSETLHVFGGRGRPDIVLAHQDGHYLLVWEEAPDSLPAPWVQAAAGGAQ
eukprot:12947981-Alexandrium_andersonii.AAC.1